MLKRFQELSSFPENAKKQIDMVMDTLIRDFKTGQAYASKKNNSYATSSN